MNCDLVVAQNSTIMAFLDSSCGRPVKRRRTDSDTALPTPPSFELAHEGRGALRIRQENGDVGERFHRTLPTALHVLRTEAAALAHITNLYTTSAFTQEALQKACSLIFRAQRTRNKLVICGVGKSGLIAQKIVATCKSLSIRASFLHASEAVHGDLGDVEEGDVVMFVSFSGRTPELMNVIPFLAEGVEAIAMTGQTRKEECTLLAAWEGGVRVRKGVLLPAPVHEKEEASFGVAAPTTSTIVALAVGDMLAMAVAEEMHGQRKRDVFGGNHPGGAIGMAAESRVANMARMERKGEKEKQIDLNAAVDLPSPSLSGEDDR